MAVGQAVGPRALLGMNRNELRRLSRIRLKEARVLLKARCFDGAYYCAAMRWSVR